MKQIKIDDLIPLLKKGWVAYDKMGWVWFSTKPIFVEEDDGDYWMIYISGNACNLSCKTCPFNIEPFKGAWQDSLMRAGETKGNLTREDIEKIMQSPKYWRDQDPESLKIVAGWFEKNGG